MRKLFLKAFLFMLALTAYGQTTATYDIVFTSNWEAHGPLPNNAHFTRLVGAAHNSNVTFLEMGGFATPGVELVAELGSNGQFSNEVSSAINANNADQFINGPDLFFNGSGRTITISDLQIDANFPLITLTSMIAPSPDWFIAVNSVSLLDANNQWISEITMDIFPYDAGTEEGNSYSLNNPATNPQERISSLRGIAPFNSQKIGTLVFTRKNIPPVVEGGIVSTTDNQTEVTITVGDGIADVISFATTSTATANYTYIITDGSGNILTNNDVSNDFEPAPAGTCRVYGISYNGELAITGKNIADTGLATGTYDLSDNSITVIREATPPAVEGGIVSTTDNQTEVTITVGDGVADVISFATTSTATANYTYIITDGSGNILTNNDVSNDFEPAPAGTCRVYGISYNGELAITGKNIADTGLATGTYDLSDNSITVIREATPPAVEGGIVSTTDNQTEVTITVGDGVADVISFATTSTATANYTYIITDGSGNILTNNDVSNDFEPAPAGTCRVYGISYNGELAITGKNIADTGLATGTYDLSDNSITVIREAAPPAVEGGMVSTTDNQTEVTITVGDGIADVISFATTSTATANYTYIITDGSGNILTNNDVSNDFEPAPAGTCRVYGISYNGELAITGKNIADAGLATGSYDLSDNSITVIREATPPAVEGGMVSTTDNQTEVTITVGDGIADVISFATTSTATANYTYIITDSSGNILANNDVSNDFEPAPAGTCRVYGISYNGELAITGKNIADAGLATGSYDLSDNSITVIREATPPAVEGGMVSTTDNQTEVTITVGDGIADVISFATTSTATANYTYIITDSSGNILTNNDVSNDFEPAPAGTCRVYGISYNGELAITGKNIADTGLATGTYDLSDNSITVIREATPPAVEGGMVSTTDNQTEVTITVGDGIADVISFATTSTATANYTYIITDGSGNILTNNDVSNDFEPAPAGTCRVYGISYNGELAITGKNIADTGLATGTYDLSDNSITVIREATPPVVEGGMVSTTDNQTEVTITVGDGIADIISFATTSTATANYTYIITDGSGNILTNNDVSNDFEPAPAGTCRVYGISYNGELAITGKNIADTGLATGTYDLSDNSITVIREASIPDPTCNDGIQNGDETGVDCGGSCEPCNTTMYCESSSNTTADEYISNVQLGTINNTSAGAANGYEDFTSISTTLSKGTSNTVTITPTWSGRTYREAYSIWIDYNQDGDFTDNGEQIWTKAPTTDASVSCTFTVPNTALDGNTRMRVSMKYNSIPTACESFRFGEVEDYTVVIGMETDPIPTCTDGIQNGDETGVDCGGSCAPCEIIDDNVVYVDIEDITVSSSKIWSPFQIEVGDSRYFGPWLSGNTLRLVTYGKSLVTEGNTNNVTVIAEGTQVGASSDFTFENHSFVVSSTSYTNWNGKSGYIGFSFKIKGATHYGWLYATVTNDGRSYTITDYAYNTKAGESLIAKRPSGTKKSGEIGKLSAFPNPFNNQLTIDVSKLSSDTFTVEIYDVLGKQVFSRSYTKNPGSFELKGQLRRPGAYFVKVVTNTESSTLQVIKQ